VELVGNSDNPCFHSLMFRDDDPGLSDVKQRSVTDRLVEEQRRTVGGGRSLAALSDPLKGPLRSTV